MREMLDALDAMKHKRLITEALETVGGEHCALGAVCAYRGLNMDQPVFASSFDIARAMRKEILFKNDEGGEFDETPEQRWKRMRDWVCAQISDAE